MQQMPGMLYHGNIGSKMPVAQEFSWTLVYPIQGVDFNIANQLSFWFFTISV